MFTIFSNGLNKGPYILILFKRLQGPNQGLGSRVSHFMGIGGSKALRYHL